MTQKSTKSAQKTKTLSESLVQIGRSYNYKAAKHLLWPGCTSPLDVLYIPVERVVTGK